MSYLKDYINFLSSFSDIKKPLKVVVDCSNGVSSLVLKELKIKNLNIFLINDNIDGDFPAHGPDPTKDGAEFDVVKTLKKESADLGVIIDGDGDRAVFVDKNGELLNPNITSWALHSLTEGPYVTDVIVFESLRLLSYPMIKEVFPSKVGTRFIKENMEERSANIGSEISGHYYFRVNINNEWIFIDSAILALIKMANIISGNSNVIEKFNNLPKLYSKQFKVNKINNKNFIFDQIININKDETSEKHHIDGTTLIFNDTFLNIRESNTEPLIKVTLVSKNLKKFDQLKEEMQKIIKV